MLTSVVIVLVVMLMMCVVMISTVVLLRVQWARWSLLLCRFATRACISSVTFIIITTTTTTTTTIVIIIIASGIGTTGAAEFFPIDLVKNCFEVNYFGYYRSMQVMIRVIATTTAAGISFSRHFTRPLCRYFTPPLCALAAVVGVSFSSVSFLGCMRRWVLIHTYYVVCCWSRCYVIVT